jgi:hypothetical protein
LGFSFLAEILVLAENTPNAQSKQNDGNQYFKSFKSQPNQNGQSHLQLSKVNATALYNEHDD